MHSDAVRTSTLQYPQAAKTQMYGVISPWHYLYWWRGINLNCMKLKWLNFAWEGGWIGRAESVLRFEARTLLRVPWLLQVPPGYLQSVKEEKPAHSIHRWDHSPGVVPPRPPSIPVTSVICSNPASWTPELPVWFFKFWLTFSMSISHSQKVI